MKDGPTIKGGFPQLSFHYSFEFLSRLNNFSLCCIVAGVGLIESFKLT